jgi:hypothetical protein
MRIYGKLPYTIIIMDNHIQVGCHFETKKEWSKITKKQAIEMGDKDLIIYKMKSILLAL